MKRILFVFAFLFALVAAPTSMAFASTTQTSSPTNSYTAVQPNSFPDEPETCA